MKIDTLLGEIIEENWTCMQELFQHVCPPRGNFRFSEIFEPHGGVKIEDPERGGGIAMTMHSLCVLLEHLIATQRQSITVMDVGANVGMMSFFGFMYVYHRLLTLNQMADIQNIQFYGFEPHKILYKGLEETIKINNFEDYIKVFNCGIGNANCTDILHIPCHPINSGLSTRKIDENSSEIFKNKDHYRVEPAEFMKLDTFCDRHNLTDIDIIKIDVEGGEMEVLEGASQLLRRCHPMLHIEHDSRAYGLSKGKDLLSYLGDYGYKYFYPIKNNSEFITTIEELRLSERAKPLR